MMARTARVAPESSQSVEIRSSKNSYINNNTNNSLLAFENPDLSSAITDKVIEAVNSNVNLQLTETITKGKANLTSSKPHKRIARSVSEVVEEKERQERNVFSRFSHRYQRDGIYGIYLAFIDEVDLFKYRCRMCFKYIYNKLTCTKQIEEE